MSDLNPGEKESKRRRKMQSRSGEPKEGGTSRDSGETSPRKEEPFDPFQSQQIFDEKAKDMAARDWVRACKTLSDESYESAADLDEITKEEVCERCGRRILLMKADVSTQLKKAQRALMEYARRYLRALREVNTQREEKEELAAKSLTVGKVLEERIKIQAEEIRKAEDERDQIRAAYSARTVEMRDIEAERDQLRAALASRTEEWREIEAERDQLRATLSAREEEEKERRAPPPRNDEPEEVEMREAEEVETREATPPISGGDIVPAILGALEEWFEAKWGQMVTQLTPSSTEKNEVTPPTDGRSGSWAGIVGRKAGERSHPTGTKTPHPGERRGETRAPSEGGTPDAGAPRPPKKTGRKKGERRKWPGVPDSAVVAVNPLPGGTRTGTELLGEAQQALSLEEMNVPPLEVRRSRMGGYLLGVRGPDAEAAADRLARGLRGLPGATGVAVSRPSKRQDLRVSGLDASLSPTVVAQSVAAAGGCPTEEVKTGGIRSSPGGMGSLWVSCPVAAAVKVAKAGGVRVGWAWAMAVLLKPRPERCFRCLELGHLKMHCTSPIDRSTRCYHCGGAGHAAISCKEVVPRCPLCRDTEEYDSCHVLGGRGCKEAPPRRQRAAKNAARVTPTGVT